MFGFFFVCLFFNATLLSFLLVGWTLLSLYSTAPYFSFDVALKLLIGVCWSSIKVHFLFIYFFKQLDTCFSEVFLKLAAKENYLSVKDTSYRYHASQIAHMAPITHTIVCQQRPPTCWSLPGAVLAFLLILTSLFSFICTSYINEMFSDISGKCSYIAHRPLCLSD